MEKCRGIFWSLQENKKRKMKLDELGNKYIIDSSVGEEERENLEGDCVREWWGEMQMKTSALLTKLQFFLSFSLNPTTHLLIANQQNVSTFSFFLDFLSLLGLSFFHPLFIFCGFLQVILFSFFVSLPFNKHPFVFFNL